MTRRCIQYQRGAAAVEFALAGSIVILLFLAFLTGYRFGNAVALLFIASMICTGANFAIFLHETRLGIRAIQVRAHILEHEADEDD